MAASRKNSVFTASFLSLLFTVVSRCMRFSSPTLHLTLSNPIFLPTTYSPTLICFGRERGWWITCNYPTVLKEKNIEKQREYNRRYLLAKVRTGKASYRLRQLANTQQKPCRTSSDIGTELENHTVGRGLT
jgi:hypothetical protein